MSNKMLHKSCAKHSSRIESIYTIDGSLLYAK